jgi:hypothetical protein
MGKRRNAVGKSGKEPAGFMCVYGQSVTKEGAEAVRLFRLQRHMGTQAPLQR